MDLPSQLIPDVGILTIFIRDSGIETLNLYVIISFISWRMYEVQLRLLNMKVEKRTKNISWQFWVSSPYISLWAPLKEVSII